MSRPEPPFPFPMWDELAEHVDRVLDGLYERGGPVTHSADCADHDHCLTSVVLYDGRQVHDPILCDLIRPLVAHWISRHQAEGN